MQVNILANYINSIKSELKPSEKKSFIVLCTLDSDDSQDEWLGSLNLIKSTIQKTEQRMMKDSQQKFNLMTEYVQNVASQDKKTNANLTQSMN